MIDDVTKNRILDTAQILDVVSEFVTLRKRGTNYIGLCPFHNERTPSFNVNPARGIFKCFGCGKSGDVARFLMEHEQMTFPEALRWLAQKYGIEIEERELTDEERQAQSRRESLLVVNEHARNWFHDQLLNTADGRAVGLAYLRSRGFRDDIIDRFQLGYCPEGPRGSNPFAEEALRGGFREENLLGAGVCYKLDDGRLRDRFHGRVMFPIHSLSGKVVAFSGRVMQKDAKTAKYVNSPESEIYVKSNELYGIWLAKAAIVRQDKCFLVEGNTDVVSMHQAGVENVVASCGTSLTTGQIRKIHRFTSNITVLYDGDSAGIHASLRGIDMLLAEGMNVRVVLLPDGEDPDSFARSHNASAFQDYIKSHEVDFITFKTNLLLDEVGRDPLRRADLVKDIVGSIAVIPDNIVRATYITACSQQLGYDERVLLSEVHERRSAARAAQNTGVGSSASASSQTTQTPAAGKPEEDADASAGMSAMAAPAAGRENTNGITAPAPVTDEAMTGIDTPLGRIEMLLMREMVRHGEKIVCMDELDDGSERPVRLASYVMEELAVDELSFSVPLLHRMADELMAHISEPDFSSSMFFIRHEDTRISALATDLVSDKYELSEMYRKDVSESLADVVYHLLNDYKLAILDQEIRTLSARLKDPAVAADPALCRQVMEQYNILATNRRVIAQQSGGRVVGV